MKKSILGLIALLVIASIAAFNISLNSKNNNLSGISLLNAEMLAYGEDNGEDIYCDGIKVRCIYTSQCEDIYYEHIGAKIDCKYIFVYKETDCEGSGSLCCKPDIALVSSTSKYVSCRGGH
jgi:hypothetical protein